MDLAVIIMSVGAASGFSRISGEGGVRRISLVSVRTSEFPVEPYLPSIGRNHRKDLKPLLVYFPSRPRAK